MNTSLFGPFKPYIEGLIDQKKAIGYPYETSARILKTFEVSCRTHHPDETKLTKAIAMHWAEQRPGEHVNGLVRRITPVRQLAKYMLRIGIDAYVIPPGILVYGAVMYRISLRIRSLGPFLLKLIAVRLISIVQPDI
jgi:integrase/recombinase XerD